ncbi:hypothetical protein GCM10008171_06940 [Methylopila jiangsuensis]|uniref:Uncharacterized protein n=2 Tax=Methylopila jiangsuensis TaxID=586230 RepID=A0A9W6JGJ7_9HYPH|nr:hypothetical protein GCM10008171_06940 [Methylopila jiangsuensis]
MLGSGDLREQFGRVADGIERAEDHVGAAQLYSHRLRRPMGRDLGSERRGVPARHLMRSVHLASPPSFAPGHNEPSERRCPPARDAANTSQILAPAAGSGQRHGEERLSAEDRGTAMNDNHATAPAGWRLSAPIVNLKGDRRTPGVWAAAIVDRDSARKAIPYGRAVPSAPLSPLSAEQVAELGLAPGEVRQIA